MTPGELSVAVREALADAVNAGEIALPDGVPAEVTVERPRNSDHGDYATNVALQLAKKAGTNARSLAELLAARLRKVDGVESVDAAGPGFLNITVSAAAQGELTRIIVDAGDRYGHGDLMTGERVNLEFVSANPTGPLHMGGTRWAAVGDALGRIFTACGADVTREYYFNDHGAQIDRFAQSLLAAARGEQTPDDGYGGEYIGEIAAEIVEKHPDVREMSDSDAREVFRREGVELMFAEIKRSLHEFGVDFDVYFHEDSLHQTGAVQHAVDRLRELGHLYEKEGALWLRSTALGDDKDRPIIRSNGRPTYISADLAYYLNKRERGFDRVVIMLGADHHGYVGRMMAMCRAFGDEPGRNLEILIGQMVNLVRDEKPVKMSKRAGKIITLEDLVDAIGVDAARYALARYSTDSTIDLDLDLWARQTNDNPVFYVQYAHARLSSILRNADELGVERGDLRPELLEHERESALLGALGEFPRIVTTAAELREPHRVARYLENLAATFHKFYDDCRVLPIGDEDTTDLHRARLWLVEATRVVIANGLGLLGVTAPERM
ncbi:MAG TPA: arginine--tRNA ligase [Actinomycetes bacterium]|nr:arginine--tRNA ligase [Actinomycetes bacterium]